MRCLEREPGRRYQSTLELQDALNACASANGWSAELAARFWAEETFSAPGTTSSSASGSSGDSSDKTSDLSNS
jgi:hypothetical protein